MPLFAWFLNVAYLALLLAVSPVILFRMVVRGKYRTGWRQKLLGRLPNRTGRSPCLWFHAVSVGEVLQLQPLLEALSRQDGRLEFVISTTTPTGFDVAQRQYPGRQIIYFPLDFSWAVNAALARIKPAAIVLVELELWPNFIFAAARRGIPVALVNGRISERSFRGYRRLRPLMAAILRKIDVLAVQSETYARRLRELGADPDRIHVTGSIKFDRIETDRQNPRAAELRRLFGLRKSEKVFIAGSTQDPEERFSLESYIKLRTKHPELRLIVVPRHKERFDDVAKLIEVEYKLPLIRRSQVTSHTTALTQHEDPQHEGPGTGAKGSEPPVILLDTLGELSACWGLADVAFVGGSLTRRGGQNMIEPAGYGAALLFGPNTWNFKDVVELLLSEHAAEVVQDSVELTTRIDGLLSNPASAAELGERARQVVLAQRGATAHTIELISRMRPAADSAVRDSEIRAA